MLKPILCMSWEVVDIYIYNCGSFVSDKGSLQGDHVISFKLWFWLTTLGGTRWLTTLIKRVLKEVFKAMF